MSLGNWHNEEINRGCPAVGATFFVYGFAKSDRENIDLDETAEFKKLARAWFTFSDRKIEAMIRDRELTEVEG